LYPVTSEGRESRFLVDVGEEGGGRFVEGGEDLEEVRDGGGGEVALDLGDGALGEARALGQIGLRQPVDLAEVLDPCADVHHGTVF
jgi:hypothetical protein